jgi:hypothetical protein
MTQEARGKEDDLDDLDDVPHYFPLNTGFRFSMNARRPSA